MIAVFELNPFHMSVTHMWQSLDRPPT